MAPWGLLGGPSRCCEACSWLERAGTARGEAIRALMGTIGEAGLKMRGGKREAEARRAKLEGGISGRAYRLAK